MRIVEIFRSAVQSLPSRHSFCFGTEAEVNLQAIEAPPPFACLYANMPANVRTTGNVATITYQCSLDVFFENTDISDTAEQYSILQEQAQNSIVGIFQNLLQADSVLRVQLTSLRFEAFSLKQSVIVSGCGGQFAVTLLNQPVC